MMLLLDGRAAKVDVLELIRRFEHPRHWELTQKLLWPRCVEAGLVDEQVNNALAERLASLSSEPPRVRAWTRRRRS